MKKIGVLLCLVALTTPAAFAGKNESRSAVLERKIDEAEISATNKAPVKSTDQVKFEKEIAGFNGNANYIGQYVLFNLADPMRGMTDEEAAPLAKEYVNYQVNGTSLVEFCKNPGVNWHRSALDELAAFGRRVEKLAKQVAMQVKFEKEIAGFNGNANYIGQYVLFNLADPMRNMTDEEAAPLAKEYVNYQVNGVSLVEFCKNPGANWHQSALDELAAFGERVEQLAK